MIEGIKIFQIVETERKEILKIFSKNKIKL